MRISLAPSMRAASNSSGGSCRKNWRNTNTATELMANGRIMPEVRVGQPVARTICTYSGMMSNWNGMTWSSSIAAKSVPRPR